MGAGRGGGHNFISLGSPNSHNPAPWMSLLVTAFQQLNFLINDKPQTIFNKFLHLVLPFFLLNLSLFYFYFFFIEFSSSVVYIYKSKTVGLEFSWFWYIFILLLVIHFTHAQLIIFLSLHCSFTSSLLRI